jgi:hypothetical protein
MVAVVRIVGTCALSGRQAGWNVEERRFLMSVDLELPP